MARTTLVLPDPLHQRLTLTAKSEGISLTRLVRDLLSKALTKREKSQLEQIYEGLRELEGIGEPGVTDASTSIDEVLYGEKGVWRGSG